MAHSTPPGRSMSRRCRSTPRAHARMHPPLKTSSTHRDAFHYGYVALRPEARCAHGAHGAAMTIPFTSGHSHGAQLHSSSALVHPSAEYSPRIYAGPSPSPIHSR
ncbi:hypothetical protein DENSPDRAFT_932126 [Dentipellis sp. KUC8613]|nr:hypothetical protein DENSPDRAFT_932126 [Dentipellis sp. KUC8613]